MEMKVYTEGLGPILRLCGCSMVFRRGMWFSLYIPLSRGLGHSHGNDLIEIQPAYSLGRYRFGIVASCSKVYLFLAW